MTTLPIDHCIKAGSGGQRVQHSEEIASGDRFAFGRNWRRFLSVVDDERIAIAQRALQGMLETERLDGMRFLDVGCGSGVFSLAAVRLGASVHSFDYDPQSVACTTMLKKRFAADRDWKIEEGSVLDVRYLERLGQFDVVYAWGVLHHTGSMWGALDNVATLVKASGALFIAIYNDQGRISRQWRAIKRLYNKSPRLLRPFVLLPIMLYYEGREAVGRLVRGGNPFEGWLRIIDPRGMHKWYDWVDWIGGYPFEVAKPEEIFDFYRKKGFALNRLRTERGGPGCNEYVFRKRAGLPSN